MILRIKRFHELTKDELYAVLRLRISVFVVEQNCPYMELDNLDQAAVHVWMEDENGIQAYLRVLDRGAENENVSIGRVIAVKRRFLILAISEFRTLTLPTSKQSFELITSVNTSYLRVPLAICLK